MWQIALSLLTVLSVLLIYLTNKHQQLLAADLPKAIRYPAMVLLIACLVSWINTFTLSAAIFIWLVQIMTALLAIPFIIHWLKTR